MRGYTWYFKLEEFLIFLRNIKHLKFDSNPDYTNYRKLFKDLFYKEQYQLEIIFDWQLSSVI